MPKFIQASCRETDEIDLRQANAVLKHQPDIIFLEYPTKGKKSERITKIPKFSKKILRKVPWAKSGIEMWKSIESLWKRGSQVVVYAVDGPKDLVVGANKYPGSKIQPHKNKNLFWWVRIYLRERFMAKNVEDILKSTNKDTLALVFLQSFHWRHVKFLLKHPSSEKIWQFYFGRFKKLHQKNWKKV